ncbi:Protein of unknown function, partial [Gryllus bimaculatus]
MPQRHLEFIPPTDTFATRAVIAQLVERAVEWRGGVQARLVSVQELLGLVRGQRFAWSLSEARWQALLVTEPRYALRLRLMRRRAGRSQVHLYARRSWPWVEALDALVLRLAASGLPDTWEKRFRREQRCCAVGRGTTERARWTTRSTPPCTPA